MKKSFIPKIALILFAVFFIALASCNKDDAKCTGTLRLTNTSSNPYTVTITGSEYADSFTLNGNTFTDLNSLNAGSYSINVKQNSGYLLYPTEESYTCAVECGKEKEIIFPQ